MKSLTFIRTAAVIFALLLLLSVLPFAVSAQDPENSIEYYGRAALAELNNSTALLYAYDSIAAGVEIGETAISVYNGTDAITVDELMTVCDAYERDYTQHFWFDKFTSYSHSATSIITVSPQYFIEGEELVAARAAFDNAVDAILSGVSDTMSDFEKELYIHDAICAAVYYDLEAPNMHNAYGALVEGRAVCDGYAEAFQYLLHRVGISSFIAVGSDIPEAGNDAIGHAWNYVELDGSYYHVDATWNDQENRVYHAYFNLNDSAMLLDHAVTPAAYGLPECTAETMNYFTVYGGKVLSPYSVDDVAALFDGGLTERNVYTDDVSAFKTWFLENVGAIVTKANIQNIETYSYAYIGNEFVMIFKTSGSAAIEPEALTVPETLSVGIGGSKTLEFTVTPENTTDKKVIYTSSDPTVATVNRNTGFVTGLKAGTATVTATLGELSDTCTVTVACTHKAKTEHKAGTSTCKVQANAKYYTCDGCGQIIDGDGETELEKIPLLPFAEHTPSQNTDNKYRVSEGDCENEAVYNHSCSVCGEKLGTEFKGEKGDHKAGEAWITDESGHRKECKCGEMMNVGEHYDNDSDGACDACDFCLPITTPAPITTTAPTTTVAPSTVPTPSTTARPDTSRVPDPTTEVPSTTQAVPTTSKAPDLTTEAPSTTQAAPTPETTKENVTNAPTSPTATSDTPTSAEPSASEEAPETDTPETAEVTPEADKTQKVTDAPSATQKPDAPKPESKGCGGFSAALCMLSLLCAAAVMIIKKK